jgi:sugar fermentation stimulation protein A
VRAELDGGQVVEAHLPDPGRLRELLFPGTRLWLEPVRASKRSVTERRTRWTLRLCRRPRQHPDPRPDEGGPHEGGVVSLDTTLPNRLVAAALEAGALAELTGWRLERPEVTVGASRFDFLLSGADGRMLLEVKSVTLVEDRVGLFPDAVTARGARHVDELAELVAEGWEAAVLFVLQRDDADEIRAARSIDPRFARALEAARGAGVRVLGRRCAVSLQGITLGAAVPAGAG